MQTRAERLEAALIKSFAPVRLLVQDDSTFHRGHAGASPDGETHYAVLIVSEAFRGLSRVARHRRVNAALADEFAAGMHALALTTRTPEEDAAAT